VESNNNHVTRLCIAIFSAIILHSAVATLLVLLDIPIIAEKEKTIPITLISANRHSSTSQTQNLSKSDNTQAAQAYLATLNESLFKKETTFDQKSDSGKEQTPNNKPQHNTHTPDFPTIGTITRSQSSASKQTLQGLQNIFANKYLKSQNTRQQISTKAIEQLSDYELELLNKLARDELYDPFHQVMKAKNKDRVDYVITLILFSNGAIKSAHIKSKSGIEEIDKLAKLTAFRASPFPAPPKKDHNNGYKYDIPIIYQPFKEDQ